MKIQNLIYTVGAVCLLSTAMMWSDSWAALCIPACPSGWRCDAGTCIQPTTPDNSNVNLMVDNDPIIAQPIVNDVIPTVTTSCTTKEDSDGNITYCCNDSGGI